MIEVEILGTDAGVGVPEREQIERLCLVALASASIRQGHVAIEFVDERRITELNGRYRGKDAPTDVLSFPIDGLAPQDADQDQPLELGDVVICPAHTTDVAEAVVHGTLHLVGMDHETDDGQMLALQRELLEWERRSPHP